MNIVKKLITRYKKFNFKENSRPEHLPIISKNRICGETINLPIALTCQPTKVCSKTCYYARDTTAIKNNLQKQTEVFYLIENNPIHAAKRISKELTGDFLRWNGGGDLTDNTVICINHLAKIRPDVNFWIVTRKPKCALKIKYSKNVYVQFSLDISSKNRLIFFMNHLEKLIQPPQWFVSYQCDKNEILPGIENSGISVLFYHNYKNNTLKPKSYCPLNDAITKNRVKTYPNGNCYTCRRCFSDESLLLKNESKLKLWAVKKPVFMEKNNNDKHIQLRLFASNEKDE